MLVRFNILKEKLDGPEVLKSEILSPWLVHGLPLARKFGLAETDVKLKV
jgi:hypothetical protein